MNDSILVGKIVNTVGLGGEIKVLHYSDGLDFFLNVKQITIDEQLYQVTSGRAKKDTIVLKLKGISTKQAADALKGKDIYVPETALPPPPDGRYYIKDIIGMEVRLPNDTPLGCVTQCLQPGSCDVYVVSANNGQEYLIPVIPDVIKEYDMQNKILRITPLEGMI